MTNSEGGVRKAECRASHGRTAFVRWLLGVVLCFGGAMVASVVAMWGAKWLVRTLSPTTYPPNHSIQLRDRAEPIMRIGHPGVVYHEEFTTLDGQPLSLTQGELQRIANKNFRVNLFHFPQHFNSRGEGTRLVSDTSGPWPWSYRTSIVSTQGQRGRHALSWFFIWPDHPGGTGYWVGYDVVTNRCLGYLGTSGLTASVPPVADQFPAWDAESRHTAEIWTDGNNYGFPTAGMGNLPLNDSGTEVGVLFVTPRRDAIYVLNLTLGSVADVRSNLPEKQLLGISLRDVSVSEAPERQTKELLLVWPDRIEFTTPTLQSLRTVMLPAELTKKSFAFAEQDGDALVTSRMVTPYRRGLKSWQHELIWFNASGEVTRRQELTLPTNGYDDAWNEEHFLSPLSLMPVSLWRYAEMTRSGQFFDDESRPLRKLDEPMTWTIWWRCLRQIARQLPWSFGLCALSGVPFAIACWRRQRRVGGSRFERLAWPALVYLFGLAGWIAFVAHREWPRRRVGM